MKARREVVQQKWNHYFCGRCGCTTVAMHEDDGVTPAFIVCRKRDVTKLAGECGGTALSAMYRCSQDDRQEPDIIWFRPADAMAAIEFITANHQPMHREAMLEHWRKGGCLMRKAR